MKISNRGSTIVLGFLVAAMLAASALQSLARARYVLIDGMEAGLVRQRPLSTQADEGYGPLKIAITGLLKQLIVGLVGGDDSQDVDRVFPSWRPVGQPPPTVKLIRDHRGGQVVEYQTLSIHPALETLEGIVLPHEPLHVSYEDFPINHYTHDFCFDVKPDAAYEHLLGIRVYPDGRREPQKSIEIEWETGLGQDNGGNPAREPNEKGRSFGFYSAGHEQKQIIWNWPTANDRVHIEGYWVWDRGHPPARTEIHPPRLVAVQRHLLAVVKRDPIESFGPYWLGTRADIFASGDGHAWWNNRSRQPYFVQKVPMSEKDYSFTIDHPLPRPNKPGVQLKWRIEKQPGDTFTGDPIIQAFPSGSSQKAVPHVTVTIPWRSRNVPDTAVFGRTVYLYWDDVDSHGVAASYRPRVFRVALDQLVVKDPQDGSIPLVGKLSGEWRVFAEVGGYWYFLNDLVQDRPLSGGLNDADVDDKYSINRSVDVYVPPGGLFRVHADGWDGDGMDELFGRLVDPYDRDRSKVQKWLNDNLLTTKVYTDGSKDDPIGEVNEIYQPSNGYGIGSHTRSSRGEKQTDDPGGETNPNDSYRFTYQIRELPWP